MIKAIQKLKERKGFTLVELIVVLVILAILAAMLIPAFTGYIDKAREQNIRTEAEMVLTAAQTVVSEQYGYGNITYDATNKKVALGTKFSSVKDGLVTEINELAEISGDEGSKYSIVIGVTGGDSYKTVKVTQLAYLCGSEKKYITYTLSDGSGTWSSTTSGTALPTLTAGAGEVAFLTNEEVPEESEGD